MDTVAKLENMPPPRKRSRREQGSASERQQVRPMSSNAFDLNLDLPDASSHTNASSSDSSTRIWGRSDTNLLSLDLVTLGAFVSKFEAQVLNGEELNNLREADRLEWRSWCRSCLSCASTWCTRWRPLLQLPGRDGAGHRDERAPQHGPTSSRTPSRQKAIRIANQTDYVLAASIWTCNL